ncbi:MAG: tripartite tricarboxylate transporter permease [Arenicellales bacterium]|jgi:putative tricarboxylic transport membrane protein
MVELHTVLAGIGDALSPVNFLFVVAGVMTGQFVGAVPGIGPVMAMAIAIPFTFVLNPLPAIAFLVGVNKGGLVGGAVPAVLINTPGTPDAAATAFDGHPLARSGKPLKATKMALYASVTGDTFSDIVLITVSAPIAVVALRMGPVEICALMIFAFSVIAGLIGDSLWKGIIAMALGLLCATVGLDPQHATPRLIFGWFQLYDGLPLAPVAIGMLAVAEILRRLAAIEGRPKAAIEGPQSDDPADRRISFAEYWDCRFTIARGALIGTFLGAMPGIGSTAAAFMSYASAKRASDDPDSFGKGNLHGIAAAESANSAVVGANLIPLLTLGIPGSVSAALIISALMIQGIEPGPLLFEQQGRLIYSLFGAMVMANGVNLLVGHLGLRIWTRVVRAPESIIFSSALLLCIVGVSLSTGGLFGVAIMLVFAGVGYLMTAFGLSVVIFIIAFFLGPRFEISMSQSLVLINGDPLAILHYPIALVLLGLAAVSVWRLGIVPGLKARAATSQ